jgi:hypothetical protein
MYKVAMVISRLVEFELLLELKFEKKRVLHCIPRVVGCVKLETVHYGLSVPVIYFDITPWFERDLA